MRITPLLVLCGFIAGCGPRQPDDTPAEQATVSVLARIPAGAPLDSMLWRLDQHLVNAMNGRLEDDAIAEFRQAEALTDRHLEARLPFEWITAEQYSVRSRLRQIQSQADRVMAQLETASPREDMLIELRSLRSEVVHLREAITRGGSRAPPSIEYLLSADSSRPPPVDPSAAARPDPTPAAPAPLGTPISSGM